MKKFKIVELFSGIGSQARALKNIGINIDVQATCEWDIHAFVAYDAIHNDEFVLDSVLQMPREEIIKKLSEFSLSNDGKTPMNAKSLRMYDDATLKRILSAITRTKNLVDINEVKGKEMPEFTDLLTYSFPCQELTNLFQNRLITFAVKNTISLFYIIEYIHFSKHFDNFVNR